MLKMSRMLKTWQWAGDVVVVEERDGWRPKSMCVDSFDSGFSLLKYNNSLYFYKAFFSKTSNFFIHGQIKLSLF